MLDTTGLLCLFQSSKLLLLLMLSLHFLLLLFEYLGIIQGNVRENGEKHSDTEEKAKTSLFCLYIVDLGIITGFFR